MLKDKRLLKPWNPESNKCNEDFIQPRINGDSFSFTVLNNTVSKEEIVFIHHCERKKPTTFKPGISVTHHVK